MSVTIKDIAKEANVSIATVSRVINGKAQGVGEETRARVEEIIKHQRYHPNRIARGLVTNRTNILGLMLPNIDNPFFSSLTRGIEDTANKCGYNVILCNSDNNDAKEKAYIRVLKESKVDGIIYTSVTTKTYNNIDTLVKHGVPFVLLDRGFSNIDVPVIFTDGESGMFQAVKHLISNDHKRIAYIAGPEGNSAAAQRWVGYQRALKEANIQLDMNIVREGNYNIDGGFRQMTDLLDQKLEFTAVACANDLMAIGVMRALNSAGIEVPKQVSVTGYDDSYVAELVTPKLTTVSQPVYQMGCAAAEMIIKIIREEKIDYKKVVFEPSLVIRESTAKRGN